MNSLSTDKYTLAWSKLADMVARGEKERALGVFRLLSQSFDNTAFALQLEGDILWAFNDGRAASKYDQAARLYFQQGKKLQAIAVYEHIILLEPTNSEYLSTLIDWYASLNCKGKQIEYGLRLFSLLLKQKKYIAAFPLLNRLDDLGNNRLIIDAYRRYIIAVMPQCEALDRDLLCCIKKVIDWSLVNNDQRLLQSFFVELESVHQEYYLAACQYLKEEACIIIGNTKQ